MKAKISAWLVIVVICFGVGLFLGRNTHSQPASTVKPSVAAQQPLFSPVAASLAQQKMCDEQAAKRFNEYRHESSLDSYTSHYDPTVNVCYVRIESYAGNPLVLTDVVYDAFGGRMYANYMWTNPHNKKGWDAPPTQCEIHIPDKPDETCKTAEEFDDLTEKYFGVAK